MAERADEERETTGAASEAPVPTAEESWARHARVRELVEQIRAARAKRERVARDGTAG
ncbi:MAG TPA: hypothetical protein VFD84_07420 [Candidatus Binatia bacterium]|jgi:hypothetical protein|nr:hypothetical protein [Candidatus Binatia bacterium]